VGQEGDIGDRLEGFLQQRQAELVNEAVAAAGTAGEVEGQRHPARRGVSEQVPAARVVNRQVGRYFTDALAALLLVMVDRVAEIGLG